MGFDLYGLQPSHPEDIPEPPDFAIATRDEALAYWNACDDYDDQHPGRYFRSNVWFWRPLWYFICQVVAPKILSEDDEHGGTHNGGYTINAVKANYIADRISALDEEGAIEDWQAEWEEERSKLGKDDADTHYPFDADLVREFGAFCRGSGGFSID